MLMTCSGWVSGLEAMSAVNRVIGGLMLIVALLFSILAVLQIVFLIKVGACHAALVSLFLHTCNLFSMVSTVIDI